jgi:hypothetical protein
VRCRNAMPLSSRTHTHNGPLLFFLFPRPFLSNHSETASLNPVCTGCTFFAERGDTGKHRLRLQILCVGLCVGKKASEPQQKEQ